MLNRIPLALAALVVVATMPDQAHASLSTGLPWEEPLNLLFNSLSGPVARIIAALAIVVTGLYFMLGEPGRAGQRLVGGAFGIALALGSVSVLGAFGFGGALF
jgi:type IV secretion system protein VirB2